MKLKYEFEFIEVDDELAAVPIGDNATDFHGMININEETKEMLEIIKTCNKTIIVSTHRPSVLKKCQRVYKIINKKIEEK